MHFHRDITKLAAGMEIGKPKPRPVEGDNADIELLREFLRTEKNQLRRVPGVPWKKKIGLPLGEQ